MRPCPNCGQEVAADKAFCPNCGAEMSAVWPPRPTGTKPNAAPPARDELQVVNGGATGCALIGVMYVILGPIAFMYRLMRSHPRGYSGMHSAWYFRFGTWPINLVPLVLVGGLYFLVKPRFPSFARGLGYSLLVVLVLLLFGLAACRN